MNNFKRFHGPAGRFAAAALLAALATVGGSSQAQAAPCLEEAFGGKTVCTSNDVKISTISVSAITETCDGSPDDTLTFDGFLNIEAVERYDIGFFLGVDPQTSTNDDCNVVVIPPGVSDLDGDQCGDTSAGTFAIPVTGIVTPCLDSNGDGFFDVNTCSTWQQNPDGNCTGPADALPGTSSKCRCEVVPTDAEIPYCTNTPSLCEDNNACTNDVCNPFGSGLGDLFGCTHENNTDPCDDGLFCNGIDVCAGGSCNHPGDPCVGGGICGDSCNEDTDSCLVAAGTLCRASGGVCDTPETCDGSSGACPADTFADSATVCRADAGDCDIAETCTGSSATCPDDSFEDQGTSCTTDGNVCTTDECDGEGTCEHNNNTDPCDDGLFCNGDDVCGGGTCNHDGDPCVGGGICGDSCNETADNCFDLAGTQCRGSNGVCDTAETCTGSSNACPADTFASGTTCRASGGVCDVAETCSGSAASCPADGFAQGGTCRASNGVCDVAETCSGSAASCPADNFLSSATVCRADAGDCDVAENCTGGSAACPVNGFEASGTQCAADENPCTDDQCNGSGSCVPLGNSETCDDGIFCNGTDTCVEGACTGHSGDPCAGGGICGDNCVEETKTCFDEAGTVCRPSAGVCDEVEECTGSSGDCPADAFDAETTCRASAGVCDVAESCSGSSASCPADAFSASSKTCRASAGVCDSAEACTGSSAACPTDAFTSGGTCRASAGVCDIAETCSGSSAACGADSFRPSTTVCRADAGDCDVAETCSGAAAACPANGFDPAGTSCTSDGNVCTTDQCNGSGSCQHTNNTISCDDGKFCTVNDKCSNGTCGGSPRQCGDQQSCTVDSCDDVADTCVNAENDEFCEDEDICTVDTCDAELGCRHVFACKDICRRFGWYAKRGGDERGDENVVQEILDAVGGLEVCGQLVDETSFDGSIEGLGLSSALEGLCVRGERIESRKLYRELVAAGLNCVMSGSEDCDAVLENFGLSVTYSQCNAACEGGVYPTDSQSSSLAERCIHELSCYNSGGSMVNGNCAYGTCDVTSEYCGADYGPCPPIANITFPILQVCERFSDNCRDESFCQEGLGICPSRTPASSSSACKEAKRNDCTIDDCPSGD